METLQIKNLTFSYPGRQEPALVDISLKIEPGEYVVLAGKSGCGKTTLLRHLKPALTPHGQHRGEILFGGRELSSLSEREQAETIGYVTQNPDNQTVTDTVWHELAFGLENLGLDSDTIRLRTAEMAEYFGISDWFRKPSNALSGGQRQLLNLASVMAMHPDVLILDEPVSQLDPVAATSFLETINKINKELGVTVILTEHRLEEILPVADKIAVMEQGRILSFTPPEELLRGTLQRPDFIQYVLPTPMRVYDLVGRTDMPCPVTVRDGRRWLQKLNPNPRITTIEREETETGEVALSVRDLYFQYEKKGDPIVADCSAAFKKGKITAILGGNGAGKTTLLKLLAGTVKPIGGKVKRNGLKLSLLPQNAVLVFTEKTVREDLLRIRPDIGEAVALTQTQDILDSHPFDISGGEVQRAALAKLLLLSPDVLLLDEPTKGMDGAFKEQFASILKKLCEQGKTVILVSHDIEFCAKHTDFCMMLFDGKIVSSKTSRDFFSGNRFYTTAAYRMSQRIFENAVTAGEVAALCKQNLTC